MPCPEGHGGDVRVGSTSAVLGFLLHGCFTPGDLNRSTQHLLIFAGFQGQVLQMVTSRIIVHRRSTKDDTSWERWKNGQSVLAHCSRALERRNTDRRPADRGSQWRDRSGAALQSCGGIEACRSAKQISRGLASAAPQSSVRPGSSHERRQSDSPSTISREMCESQAAVRRLYRANRAEEARSSAERALRPKPCRLAPSIGELRLARGA